RSSSSRIFDFRSFLFDDESRASNRGSRLNPMHLNVPGILVISSPENAVKKSNREFQDDPRPLIHSISFVIRHLPLMGMRFLPLWSLVLRI
ncbi:hypothetical protein LINGRAHAP2_LOCUS3886, partial [Linum grandiflorum]